MKQGLFILFIMLIFTMCSITVVHAQTPSVEPIRAVWVATVYNLDIPLESNPTAFKTYYLSILDTMQKYHMNTIVFQVRPLNDAFYVSDLNPWSRYLTGVEGKDPGWDPLPWMIDETHKRGISFQAWFNPYRVTTEQLSPTNFAYLHPDDVIQLPNAATDLLNPGIPEVQQFVIQTIMEVAKKYDIDGVHLDDYFYPYDGLDSSLDSSAFETYNPNQLSIGDWRRENVNTLIKGIKAGLTAINEQMSKKIQFGVSPFGVWANKSSHPLGSDTSSLQSYSDLYADTRLWVKNNWVDYIAPQVYWAMDDSHAAYKNVVSWWADVVRGTNVSLYIGQAFYRYQEAGYNSNAWVDPSELIHQMDVNDSFPEVKGTIQFRYSYLVYQGSDALIACQNELKTINQPESIITPDSTQSNFVPMIIVFSSLLILGIVEYKRKKPF